MPRILPGIFSLSRCLQDEELAFLGAGEENILHKEAVEQVHSAFARVNCVPEQILVLAGTARRR